jgi:hypothetical protein
MAKAATRKAAAKKQGGGSIGLWILGILLMILGILLLPSTILLLAGMVPTMVAILTDLDSRKPAAMSVGAVNLCGVLPFEIALWRGGQTMPHAMQLLTDIETLAAMYGAAALGSVIYYAVPPVVGGLIAYRSQMRVHELERRQAALREAWGGDVVPGGR